MPSTTNFNWTTPADTDLVKDGAAAIRTLGNGIDTSLVDLKGGTTGQILSKASNTDLDYTWINNDQGDITGVTAGTGLTGGGTSGAVTLTNDMATTITAAGDIVVGTGNGTYDNLPIGTTGQVLTADTTVSPYKVKWAAAGGGASWTTWTPTLTNLTLGNGTQTARYVDNNGTVTFFWRVVFGSTTSIGGNITVTLPLSAKSSDYNFMNFIVGGVRDDGVSVYLSGGEITSANAFTLQVWEITGGYLTRVSINATRPVALGTNDILFMSGTYEKA